VLYLCRELSTMWGVVITEISKRLDMRMVSGFVAVFVPIGQFVCAISPLADAAFYLRTADTRQDPLKDAKEGLPSLPP
jgi:hypothetical protein